MEEKTRQELNELGISHELLKNEIQKGSRSPVIGAYRIILQRNLRNTQKQNKLDSGGKGDISFSILSVKSLFLIPSETVENIIFAAII